MKPIESILVYTGQELIGDGFIKLSFLQSLRRAYPQARIVWWSSDTTVFTGDLSRVVTPYVNEVWEKTGWFEARRKISGQHLDLVIDTQKMFYKSLALKLLGAKYFVSSAANGFFSSFKVPKEMPKHDIERLMALASAAGTPLTFKREPLPIPKHLTELAAHLLPGNKSYVGLVPGAGRKDKCWPLKHYITLGQKLWDEGHIPVYILGPAENSWRIEIENYVPGAVFPLQAFQANRSSLFTIALATHLKAAVSNDCGAGHMMAAADIPLISLFGPTSPTKLRPMITEGSVIKAQDFLAL